MDMLILISVSNPEFSIVYQSSENLKTTLSTTWFTLSWHRSLIFFSFLRSYFDVDLPIPQVNDLPISFQFPLTSTCKKV